MSFFDKKPDAEMYGAPDFDESRKAEKRMEIIQALLSGSPQVPVNNYGPLNAIADVLARGVAGYKTNQLANTQAAGMESYRKNAAAASAGLQGNWDNREAILSALNDPYVGDVAQERAKDFKDTWVDEGTDPVTGASRQRSKTTGKLDYGPTPSKGQHITVNTGPKTHDELMKYGIDYLKRNEQLFNEGAQQFAQTEKAKAAIQEGTLKGNMAGVAQALAEFTHSLGAQLDPKTANLEVVKTAMVPLVLEKLKVLKPASDTDREFLQKATAQDPTMMADQDAVELFNVYQRALQRNVQHYTKVKDIVGRLAAGEAPGRWTADVFATPDLGDFGEGKDPATLPAPAKPPKRIRYDEQGNPLP